MSGSGRSGRSIDGLGIEGRSTSMSGSSDSSHLTRMPRPSSGNSTLAVAASGCRAAYRTGCSRPHASRRAARLPSGGPNGTFSGFSSPFSAFASVVSAGSAVPSPSGFPASTSGLSPSFFAGASSTLLASPSRSPRGSKSTTTVRSSP